MPAVNRRARPSPTKSQAVQDCVALLLNREHKLVKVRSIGSASPTGDTPVQASLASGESVDCNLPQELQSQLLFRGSGFLIVAPSSLSNRKHSARSASNSAHSRQQTSDAANVPNAQIPGDHALSNDSDSQGSERPWRVVYVLADDDLPELARQGLWPAEFEADGIDGISNGQKVDLRTMPKVEPPAVQQQKAKQTSAVLNESFYDSDEDDTEEHMFGCPCCPAGRNVVFRVY